MLYTGHLLQQPAAVRYPRGNGIGCAIDTEMQQLEVGKGRVVRKSEAGKIAILSFGTALHDVLPCAEQLDATVADMRFVKPLDEALINELAASHELLVTVEDNVVAGGAGSAVGEYLHAQGSNTQLLQLGLPDSFIKHGGQDEIRAELELDAEGLEKRIRERMARM